MSRNPEIDYPQKFDRGVKIVEQQIIPGVFNHVSDLGGSPNAVESWSTTIWSISVFLLRRFFGHVVVVISNGRCIRESFHVGIPTDLFPI